ncbi:calcium-translocating P-type ATPase [Alternaria alternata]|jgi:hypothetical protein|nr:calcium-translocating P-type ATPase [Alternaria alternata]
MVRSFDCAGGRRAEWEGAWRCWSAAVRAASCVVEARGLTMGGTGLISDNITPLSRHAALRRGWSKERQFAKLNCKNDVRIIRACRSSLLREIPVYNTFVSNIVALEADDMIPANGILIQSQGSIIFPVVPRGAQPCPRLFVFVSKLAAAGPSPTF